VSLAEVELSSEQQEFVRRAVASGRVRDAAGAVREPLALWVERERRREEILAAIDQAEASLARGEGRVITRESMREVAEDVKRRGCARLAAEKKSGR
jgi:Arc/MetJ-type ribon-helix-helix transcriptional regulator